MAIPPITGNNTSNKVMHGARAIIAIGGRSIGIFSQVSYSLVYDVSPVFILGRLGPAELGYTAQEAVSVSCSGWRVLDSGPHARTGGNVPFVNNLLTQDDVTITIYDRVTAKPIMTVVGCKCQGYSTSISHRQMQEITVNFIGLSISDESPVSNVEGAGANSMP